MHPEAFEFVRSQVIRLPRPASVLEIGSRDINGSPRALFDSDVDYLGIDIQAGPGVDLVVGGRNLIGQIACGTQQREQSQILTDDGALVPGFDVVICTEVLEHAETPEVLIQVAFGATTPGGVFILTCATHPRSPHSMLDGGGLRLGEHYGNIAPTDLRQWLMVYDWYRTSVDTSRGDLYAVAKKAARVSQVGQ